MPVDGRNRKRTIGRARPGATVATAGSLPLTREDRMIRITWAALVAALLGLAAGSTPAAEPLRLPDMPLPAAAAPATAGHPPAVAGETDEDAPPRFYGLLAPFCRDGGCLESCCQHCGCCWDHLCTWLTFHPCRVTNLHYQCVPYNPTPPLYAYFLYPPVVDGPGVAYPCCNRRGFAAGDHAPLDH